MKLNPAYKYVTRYTGDADVIAKLTCKLPSYNCVVMPNVLAVFHNGVYHIVKSRWEMEGDPKRDMTCEPVDPYTLSFTVFILEELLAVCKPATMYAVPDEFYQANILVIIPDESQDVLTDYALPESALTH